MSDLATVVNAAFVYAHESADFATVVGPPSACFRIPATQGLLKFAEEVDTQDELTEILRRVAPTVGVPDRYKAAIMALLCGTLIEWGANPAEVAGLLLARLPTFLQLAGSVADRVESETPEALFAKSPDAFKAWHALSLMLLPTMAVLTRGMEFREAARDDDELVRSIEALREHNQEADFVASVLGFCDGVELTVLHPDEGRAFRVALEAVHTNAHLFTLLQGELINGGHLPGKPVDTDVLGIATGEMQPTRVMHDSARWQFYNWTALRVDGTCGGADISTWLFVEDPPTAIPELDGERIVILGPPVLANRSWDSNFFANIHDALRSRASVIEVLPAEQVIMLQDRIMRAQR